MIHAGLSNNQNICFGLGYIDNKLPQDSRSLAKLLSISEEEANSFNNVINNALNTKNIKELLKKMPDGDSIFIRCKETADENTSNTNNKVRNCIVLIEQVINRSNFNLYNNTNLCLRTHHQGYIPNSMSIPKSFDSSKSNDFIEYISNFAARCIKYIDKYLIK